MHTQVVIGLALLVSVIVISTEGQAQMFIYPEKGQSKDQQDLDQFTCHKWAKEKTGIDPNQTSMAAAPAPAEQGRRRGRRAEMQHEEQAQKASVERQQQQKEFNRAYGVCLEGKGYKVG